MNRPAERENISKKVLLHCCCAPCGGAIIERMLKEGLTPVVFYSNSNIFPSEEYAVRRDECRRYCLNMGVEFIEDDYAHEEWRTDVASGLEDAPERGPRCLGCFSFRLRRAAAYAHAHGIPLLTTSLASSRWKSLEQIDEAGYGACREYAGVEWWPRNWRKGGLQERRGQIIREQNFYNQRYCGCEFSMGNGSGLRTDSERKRSGSPPEEEGRRG